MHNVITSGEKYMVACGNTGSSTRNIPYPPTFNNIAASITEPSVGDSTCASGSHM